MLEEKFATVSYEEMCATIERRIEGHEQAAKQQLRTKNAAEQLKMKNLLKKTAEAYTATDRDKLKSNKTGSPGFSSMGGLVGHKELTELKM